MHTQVVGSSLRNDKPNKYCLYYTGLQIITSPQGRGLDSTGWYLVTVSLLGSTRRKTIFVWLVAIQQFGVSAATEVSPLPPAPQSRPEWDLLLSPRCLLMFQRENPGPWEGHSPVMRVTKDLSSSKRMLRPYKGKESTYNYMFLT